MPSFVTILPKGQDPTHHGTGILCQGKRPPASVNAQGEPEKDYLAKKAVDSEAITTSISNSRNQTLSNAGQQSLLGPFCSSPQRHPYTARSSYGSPAMQTGNYHPHYYADQMASYSNTPSFGSPGYHQSGSDAGQGSSASGTHGRTHRRTRSGRLVPSRTASPHPSQTSTNRVNKAKPSRRPKASKSEKLKTPRLTAPLSVLTKDMDIPLRDMGAWVNRSAQERLDETQKRNGYITRPMNSFMLYRSAYADRTKHWCLQNNHQVVSAVSGESWPMEPDEIRNLYNNYAKIERDNHQLAHPNYKFSPAKPGAPPKKQQRSGYSEDEMDEPSDLDDPDATWEPRGKPQPSARKEARTTFPTHSDMNSLAFEVDSHLQSTQWASGPGLDRSLVEAVHSGYGNPYYGHLPVRQPKTGLSPTYEHQGMQYSLDASLSGIPGGSHQDLLTTHTGGDPGQAQLEYDQSHVDPTLLSGMPTTFEPQYIYPQAHDSPMGQHATPFGINTAMMQPPNANMSNWDQHQGNLTYFGSGEHDSEFDKQWMV